MRAKQTGLIAVVTLALLFLLTMNASAAWFTASINEVGSTSSKIAVRLSDNAASPAFTNNWFF